MKEIFQIVQIALEYLCAKAIVPKLCAKAPKGTMVTMRYFKFSRETVISVRYRANLKYFTLSTLYQATFL